MFLVVFLGLALLERWYEYRFSHRAERGIRKMAWSYAALHLFYLAVFVATAVEYFGWPRPVRGWVTGVGLTVFAVSLLIRLLAIRTLGRFWSLDLEIRREHKLITEGIYGYVRHPAYLAIMLEVIAVPLVANAYGALVVAGALYLPLLLWRWSREEREMVDKFGNLYVEYQHRVPAFFPWPHGK